MLLCEPEAWVVAAQMVAAHPSAHAPCTSCVGGLGWHCLGLAVPRCLCLAWPGWAGPQSLVCHRCLPDRATGNAVLQRQLLCRDHMLPHSLCSISISNRIVHQGRTVGIESVLSEPEVALHLRHMRRW